MLPRPPPLPALHPPAASHATRARALCHVHSSPGPFPPAPSPHPHTISIAPPRPARTHALPGAAPSRHPPHRPSPAPSPSPSPPRPPPTCGSPLKGRGRSAGSLASSAGAPPVAPAPAPASSSVARARCAAAWPRSFVCARAQQWRGSRRFAPTNSMCVNALWSRRRTCVEEDMCCVGKLAGAKSNSGEKETLGNSPVRAGAMLWG